MLLCFLLFMRYPPSWALDVLMKSPKKYCLAAHCSLAESGAWGCVAARSVEVL